MNTDSQNTPAADPAFDAKSAKRVAQYRHDKTGRTVGFHQHDNAGPQADNTHLFSATGVFIASVKKAEADKLATDAKAAADKRHAEEVAAAKAAHERNVKLAKLKPAEREALLKDEAAKAAAE